MDIESIRNLGGETIPVLLFGRILTGLETIKLQGRWHVWYWNRYIGSSANDSLEVYCNYLDREHFNEFEAESLKAVQDTSEKRGMKTAIFTP